MYGLPATPATETSSTLAVSGFIEQYANEAGQSQSFRYQCFLSCSRASTDLKTFLTDLRTDMDPSTTFTLETIDGVSLA